MYSLKMLCCVYTSLFLLIVSNLFFFAFIDALSKVGMLLVNGSCLIARNLLNGLRTCWEVFQYMTNSENKLFGEGDAANSLLEGYSKFDLNGNMVSIFILYGLLGSKYWTPFI